MKIGLIGNGAIATYVRNALEQRPHQIDAVLMRPTRVAENPGLYVGSVQDLPDDLDLVIDCAGHAALAAHGPAVLRRGIDMITVSLGALAEQNVLQSLEAAANEGGAKLHLASGAIGALDCLQAARVGQLEQVTYVGRKPPIGWQGSPAEQKIDLGSLKSGAQIHFEGTAREAALAYPKNANVAAAVALAGVGFDKTHVRLIADADISSNIHEIEATGDFGSFRFQISGQSLPDNPRSSALAAMSVLSKLDNIAGTVTL
ncbi:aspartate dehydrogenase [Sulfitobacter sp. SK012]|uniref:aspartate dehydrogenase n=1 Tax=Sulfitobacter sp. SK012 TaxID=1389005 RepID=UPI000E0AEBC7|nr:aspartate dehydrogenase [Sulfitobacter sp. SK012]AXI44778.1 aspartate dehydrogenase [Sulfitobacter sp. SK012]